MTSPRRLVLLVAALSAVALTFAVDHYFVYQAEGMAVLFRGLLALQFTLWYLWIGVGPLAWWCAQRWPIRAGHKVRGVVRHLLVAMAVSSAILISYTGIYAALLEMPVTRNWYTDVDRGRPLRVNMMFFFSAYFHMQMFAYSAVVAIAHAVRSANELRARERETLQLSEQLATARLQVLTAQLQPHFLFNTLHTIGSLVLQRKNEQATEMLAELGELLRITLERQSAELITLSDEFEHLKRYLHIEETRFGDRLTVTWRIDPKALEMLVPPLILQPIVENALKHGVAARTGAASVDIQASIERLARRLQVSVYNDGPPLSDAAARGRFGFGLRNVTERLVTLDPHAKLTLENVDHRGVRATIDLPALQAADDQRGAISA